MNSFIETNEQTVIDFNTIKPKLKDQGKSYTFFVYFHPPSLASQSNATNLQKIAFKLKQQKPGEKAQSFKNIALFFIDISNQFQVDQSMIDIKNQILEGRKSKIIIYGHQAQLIQLIARASLHDVDIANIPIAIYSIGLHSDLATCLGWQSHMLGNLTLKATSQFQENVKKWISSPSQKIDVWEAQITVDSKNGNILKLSDDGTNYLHLPDKTITEQFISHFSIGYHPKLTSNYESQRKPHSSITLNKFIYSLESMKKFCCVGMNKINNGTGVVQISWKDEKGHQIEIMKVFADDDIEEMDCKKKQQKRKILTILLSNIDRFHGQKIKSGKSNFKMNDSKLELFTFESSKDYSVLSSISGEIKFTFNSEELETYIQINNTCYKLYHSLEIKVKMVSKIKMLINKDILEC